MELSRGRCSCSPVPCLRKVRARVTLDERGHLVRRQGEVCRELEALRAGEFCPGDESPLILEDGLNGELDRIEAALAEDGRCEPGGEG
jgi:hypothetical protein